MIEMIEHCMIVSITTYTHGLGHRIGNRPRHLYHINLNKGTICYVIGVAPLIRSAFFSMPLVLLCFFPFLHAREFITT